MNNILYLQTESLQQKPSHHLVKKVINKSLIHTDELKS